MEFFNIILIIGIAQGFIFNGVNFYRYKFTNTPILYINLFVLALTLNNLQALLIEKEIYSSFYYLRHLLVPWYIFITPLFFAFLTKHLRLLNNIKLVLVTTTLVFCISIIIRLFVLYSINENLNEFSFLSTLKSYNTIEEFIGFLLTLLIFIYCIVVFIKAYRSSNDILKFDNLIWLKTFFIIGFIAILFWLLAIILNTAYSFEDSSIIYSPLRVITSILIYWVGYQGMYQQKIISNRISIRKNIEQEYFLSNSKTKVNKNKSKQKELFYKINYFIIEEKKFIDPLLSLELVSEHLNYSTSQISLIINKFTNNNFSDYINEQRVLLAKRMLANKEFKQYSILSIGLESGFNSKSTFYNAFKKHTGITPAKYRKGIFNK